MNTNLDREERHRRPAAVLAYSVAGEGTPVLCIQGVGIAGSGWLPQRDALSRHHRVITFDNAGVGASPAPDSPLTIQEMARAAAAILEDQRCSRVHLVGHSMGGLIALHLASQASERIVSLSLLCTFADGAAPMKFSWRMAWLGLRARAGTRAIRRNAMLDMVMPAEYLRGAGRRRTAKMLSALFGHDLADQPPVAGLQLKAMSRFDARPILNQLANVPTLVVSGAHDPIAPPRLGRALADGIPGAAFVEFAEAGHALPIQCADRLNALLLGHFSAAERRRADDSGGGAVGD
jgi:pimeloyl-ACP methyl ester carboxylesterase